MELTLTDYAIVAAALILVLWVVYGVVKRIVMFLLVLAAGMLLLTGIGYFQTGRFSDGFFAHKSGIVKFVGQLVDGYRQGVYR